MSHKTEIWSRSSRLSSRVASDMGVVNITGLAADQIRASIRKAGSAFVRPVDKDNINLVIAEVDQHQDIDIAEACFGTEYELVRIGGGSGWCRKGDGGFIEPRIAENVAGLVALRRPDKAFPVSQYEMVLYINEKHSQFITSIQAAFPIKQVIHYNMRPA